MISEVFAKPCVGAIIEKVIDIDEDYFVFDRNRGIKRELSKAILFNNGIPYLAPEIVLLYNCKFPYQLYQLFF